MLNKLAADSVRATTVSIMLSLFRKWAGNLHFFTFVGVKTRQADECKRVRVPFFCTWKPYFSLLKPRARWEGLYHSVSLVGSTLTKKEPRHGFVVMSFIFLSVFLCVCLCSCTPYTVRPRYTLHLYRKCWLVLIASKVCAKVYSWFWIRADVDSVLVLNVRGKDKGLGNPSYKREPSQR